MYGLLSKACLVAWAVLTMSLPGGFVSIADAQESRMRQWSDANAHHQFEAELLALSDKTAVLELQDGELVSVDVEDLSESDREHLKSENSKLAASTAEADQKQVWELEGGLKFPGRIVDFAQRTIVIRRHLAKTLVNDREYSNLPPIYREFLPYVVGNFAKAEITTQREMENWLIRQEGRKASIQCDGVMMEMADGDRYGIPLFFFSTEDQAVLKPAWQRWESAKNDLVAQEQEAMRLRIAADRAMSEAAANAKATQDELRRLREIAELSLRIDAYDAGLFDLWRISLSPPTGSYARELRIVVPARNSDEARQAALDRHPNYRVTAIVKIRNRR